MNHADIDRVSLEIHRRIALRLRQEPRLTDVARENLDRWMKLNGHIPSLRRDYEEWRRLLDLPLEKLCAVMVEETDEGQRLRQNSPFAGVLPREEVWDIKRAARRHAATAA
jgi:hypothetical protein